MDRVHIGFLLAGPILLLVNADLIRRLGFEYPCMLAGLGQIALYIGSLCVEAVYGATQHDSATSSTLRCLAAGCLTGIALATTTAQYIYLPCGYASMMQPLSLCFMVVITSVDTRHTALPSRTVVLLGGVVALLVGVTLLGRYVNVLMVQVVVAVKVVEAVCLLGVRGVLDGVVFEGFAEKNIRLAPGVLLTLLLGVLGLEAGPFLERGDVSLLYSHWDSLTLSCHLTFLTAALAAEIQKGELEKKERDGGGGGVGMARLEVARSVFTSIAGSVFFVEYVTALQWLLYVMAVCVRVKVSMRGLGSAFYDLHANKKL